MPCAEVTRYGPFWPVAIQLNRNSLLSGQLQPPNKPLITGNRLNPRLPSDDLDREKEASLSGHVNVRPLAAYANSRAHSQPTRLRPT